MTDHRIDIVIEIPGGRLRGTLESSPVASSLLALFPLTLQFTDFGAQEKIAKLPTALSTAGAPRSSNAPTGTIAYYQPSRSIVLYYDDVGTFPGIMPVGSFDSPDVLRGLTEDFTATISRT